MTLGNPILLICLVFSLYGVGSIWFLQLNHYPLYESVGRDVIGEYVIAHNRRLLVPVILPSDLAFASSIALANPPEAPFQAYSWLVLSELAVLSFADLIGTKDLPADAAQARAHFGGTPAPVVHLKVEGDRAGVA